MTRWVMWMVVLVWIALASPSVVVAAYQCGGVSDTCQCGKNNPYPCCDNGSNCTWWAWHMACCNWGKGLPGWGNANTWGSYASQNGNFDVLSYPVVGAIATSTKGQYGHVAYVTGVGNGTITVSEMNCCGTCAWGTGSKTYQASYFNSGFVVPKGGGPAGPYCGNGKCDGGENCASCGQDCGSCCGNGACDHGENCSSCSKDCGSCCGNGACDWGESCSSCSKDCICLPTGSLDNASCLQVRGWVWDTDSSTPVVVRVKVDGNDYGTLTANGAYPGHDGHGFVWEVPPDLRNGVAHQVHLEAQDTTSSGFTTLGPKTFFCENKVTTEGIWTITRTNASGIVAEIPNLDPPVAAFLHGHKQDDPLSISGVVQSCTTPVVGSFDAVRGRVEFHHSDGKFTSGLTVDNLPLFTPASEASVVLELTVDVAGSALCLTTTALSDTVAPVAESAAFVDWATRSGRFWTHYSPDAAGIIVAYPGLDVVRVQRREGFGEPVAGSGWVTAVLPLSQPVNSVSTTVLAGAATTGQAAFDLVLGDEVFPLTLGAQTVVGQGSADVGLRVRMVDDPLLTPDFAVDFETIRVHQSGKHQDGPWWVEKHASYGFSAQIPSGVSALEPGRCIVLEHKTPDWWSTGAVTATLTFAGVPFERIRAVYTADIPEDGFRLDVYAENELVVSKTLMGVEKDTLDVEAAGNTVIVAFGITQERPSAANAKVEVARLEVLRDGWWSAPSPYCAGMRDDRLPGGGVRLENSRAWGILGNTAQGVNLVHRSFNEQYYGVRFGYAQDLSNEAYAIVVMLDDAPIQIIDEYGLFEAYFQNESVPFEKLGFAMVAKGQGGVYPYRWAVDIDAIEVLGADGQWRAVNDLDSEIITHNPEVGVGQGRSVTIDEPESKAGEVVAAEQPRSGGCQTSGGGRSPWIFTTLFGLFCYSARRRTNTRRGDV